MNPDNSNQNQSTEQAPQQLPSPSQPWQQQPPSSSLAVPPTALAPSGGRNNRFLIMVIVLVVAVIVGVGGWLLMSTSSETNGSTPVTVTVPEEWEILNTELDFTVEAPAEWSSLSSFEAEINNLASEYVNLGPPTNSNSEAPTEVEKQQNITASILETTDTSGEQAFVAAVTDEKAIAKNYGLLGEKSDQIRLVDSSLSINGREWLKIDLDVSGNSTTLLYHWVGSHAVGLSMVNSGNTKQDTSFYQNYLLPMAASVKVTE